MTGHNCGHYRRSSDDYDPRWDFADAARAGKEYFAEFKRGFTDGMDGKDPTP